MCNFYVKFKKIIPFLLLFYILNKNLFDGITFGVSKYLFYAVVGMGSVLGLSAMLRFSELRKIVISFIIYCGIVIVNGIFFSNRQQFTFGVKAYIIYFLPFFALLYFMQGSHDYTKLFKCVGIWGGITSVLAVYEYVARQSVLPWFEGMIYIFENGSTAYRATVFIGSPMVLGIALGFSLIFCFYFLHKERKWYYLLLIGLNLLGLLCTGSRGPLVLSLLGVGGLYILFYRQGTVSRKVITTFVSIVAGGALILLPFILFPKLSTGIEQIDFLIYRVTSTLDFSNEWGNVARLQIWEYYIRQILKQPLLGYGIGSVNAEVVSNIPIAFDGFYAINPESGVLARFVETGFIGATSYYVLLYLCIKTGLKHVFLAPKKVAENSSLIAVAGVLVMIFMEDMILQISLDIFCVFIMCFLLAYSVNYNQKLNEPLDAKLLTWLSKHSIVRKSQNS